MKIIGITGPSGAGKTTALNVLRQMGACVLNCDEIYHRLLSEDERLLQDIEAAFPNAVTGGDLDRKALGEIVFVDPTALQTLNRITHGRVCEEVLRLLDECDSDLAAIDAIGLFESGLNGHCDLTVAVVASEQTRIARLMARDGISEHYAKQRIAAQRSAEDFSALCDLTLENNGTPAEFEAACKTAFGCISDI